MRTTTIGCTTEAGGATPGIRRPVRTMTEPPTPSRRMRLGLPTSPVDLRGDGGRLEPETRLTHGGGGLTDDLVRRRSPIRERQVEADQFEVEPEDGRIEHPQRFVEQLLPCLVTVTDDDLVAR